MSFLQPGCCRQLLTSLAPSVVLVDHREVVVDVAVLRPGAHLPPAHADGPDGVAVLHDPGADVEEVDVLLDVEVAREPGEVVPVPHLVRHLGPVRLLGLGPAAAAVVVGEERDDLADGAVVDAAGRSRGSRCRSAGTGRRRPTAPSSSPARRSPGRSGRPGRRRPPASRRRRACRPRPPPGGAAGGSAAACRAARRRRRWRSASRRRRSRRSGLPAGRPPWGRPSHRPGGPTGSPSGGPRRRRPWRRA